MGAPRHTEQAQQCHVIRKTREQAASLACTPDRTGAGAPAVTVTGMGAGAGGAAVVTARADAGGRPLNVTVIATVTRDVTAAVTVTGTGAVTEAVRRRRLGRADHARMMLPCGPGAASFTAPGDVCPSAGAHVCPIPCAATVGTDTAGTGTLGIHAIGADTAGTGTAGTDTTGTDTAGHDTRCGHRLSAAAVRLHHAETAATSRGTTAGTVTGCAQAAGVEAAGAPGTEVA